MKRFLVQTFLDGKVEAQLMTEQKVIDFVCMDDCYPEIDYTIFDLSVYGKATEIHYVGWQPNCLIELADSNGIIRVSGYGPDH